MKRAIISDIHGNLSALEAVMGDIDEQALIATIYEVVGRLDTTNENLAAIQ